MATVTGNKAHTTHTHTLTSTWLPIKKFDTTHIHTYLESLHTSTWPPVHSNNKFIHTVFHLFQLRCVQLSSKDSNVLQDGHTRAFHQGSSLSACGCLTVSLKVGFKLKHEGCLFAGFHWPWTQTAHVFDSLGCRVPKASDEVACNARASPTLPCCTMHCHRLSSSEKNNPLNDETNWEKHK